MKSKLSKIKLKILKTIHAVGGVAHARQIELESGLQKRQVLDNLPKLGWSYGLIERCPGPPGVRSLGPERLYVRLTPEGLAAQGHYRRRVLPEIPLELCLIPLIIAGFSDGSVRCARFPNYLSFFVLYLWRHLTPFASSVYAPATLSLIIFFYFY